uniref:Uncharacterized protein n=1 Tax=Setaria viridis TaxID=4556 RepID=A0A4U6WAX5_SETVI|nr:hypothetical protein SEVIR_1G200266v2 [Setaria viridis]
MTEKWWIALPLCPVLARPASIAFQEATDCIEFFKTADANW